MTMVKTTIHTTILMNRSRFLNTMTVDANGIIQATEQNTGATAAGGGVIEMGPFDNTGAAVTAAGGVDIAEWRCGIGATDVEARFRPGSCQG